MLEYYEPLMASAKRLGVDSSWLRLLCEKERIYPHAVKLESRWFLPQDAEILTTKERGKTKYSIDGYESVRQAGERLGVHRNKIAEKARKGLLGDPDSFGPQKVGGVWFIPSRAFFLYEDRDYKLPKEKRQYLREKKQRSRERAKVKEGVK